MKIPNKAVFYDLWNQNKLGNKLRSWSSVQELKNSGFNGLVVMRAKAAGSNIYEPNINIKYIDRWAGYDGKVNFNEQAPDHALLIQGEVLITEKHYNLIYSKLPLKMRDALRLNPLYAEGLNAKRLLEYYLDANSYEDLMTLLELYPTSVIEFSTYGCKLGVFPNRNTIIWEVRTDY